MYLMVDFNANKSAILPKVNQQHLGRFEIWCWRKKEKVSLVDRVRNEK